MDQKAVLDLVALVVSLLALLNSQRANRAASQAKNMEARIKLGEKLHELSTALLQNDLIQERLIRKTDSALQVAEQAKAQLRAAGRNADVTKVELICRDLTSSQTAIKESRAEAEAAKKTLENLWRDPDPSPATFTEIQHLRTKQAETAERLLAQEKYADGNLQSAIANLASGS